MPHQAHDSSHSPYRRAAKGKEWSSNHTKPHTLAYRWQASHPTATSVKLCCRVDTGTAAPHAVCSQALLLPCPQPVQPPCCVAVGG